MHKQLAAACLFVSLAFAQGIGTIHGTVTDASGRAVAQAKVVAVLEERKTTRSIETDSEGSYVFPSLPIGKYAVRVEAPGFKTFSQTGVELTSNENARVDAVLEVGSLNQSVSVVAEAAGVDSRSSTVGTVLDSRRVVELPINGRNIISLVGLLAGRLAGVGAADFHR